MEKIIRNLWNYHRDDYDRLTIGYGITYPELLNAAKECGVIGDQLFNEYNKKYQEHLLNRKQVCNDE
jgi:hypothetical protein